MSATNNIKTNFKLKKQTKIKTQEELLERRVLWLWDHHRVYMHSRPMWHDKSTHTALYIASKFTGINANVNGVL